MTLYRQMVDPATNKVTGVQRSTDGAVIPADPYSVDFIDFVAWVELGNRPLGPHGQAEYLFMAEPPAQVLDAGKAIAKALLTPPPKPAPVKPDPNAPKEDWPPRPEAADPPPAPDPPIPAGSPLKPGETPGTASAKAK